MELQGQVAIATRVQHGRDKSWGLAMLAPKRSLRVAPVPPKTADLTRPGAAAGAMAGRDEGTDVGTHPAWPT